MTFGGELKAGNNNTDDTDDFYENFALNSWSHYIRYFMVYSACTNCHATSIDRRTAVHNFKRWTYLRVNN